MTFLCHWLDPENPEAIDAPTPAEAAELFAGLVGCCEIVVTVRGDDVPDTRWTVGRYQTFGPDGRLTSTEYLARMAYEGELE